MFERMEIMVNILHYTTKSLFLDTFFTDAELVIPMNRLPDQQVPPAGDNPAEENPAGENLAGENLAEENPAEEIPAGENPAEENLAEENPAEENLAEENLAGVRDEEREADVVQGAELSELHDLPQQAN